MSQYCINFCNIVANDYKDNIADDSFSEGAATSD